MSDKRTNTRGHIGCRDVTAKIGSPVVKYPLAGDRLEDGYSSGLAQSTHSVCCFAAAQQCCESKLL
jgi:hypothetical protein